MSLLQVGSSARRDDQTDHLSLVATVYAKVFLVHGDDSMSGMELAHPNEAEIRQVGLPIGVADRESFELRKVLVAFERDRREPVSDHS